MIIITIIHYYQLFRQLAKRNMFVAEDGVILIALKAQQKNKNKRSNKKKRQGNNCGYLLIVIFKYSTIKHAQKKKMNKNFNITTTE